MQHKYQGSFITHDRGYSHNNTTLQANSKFKMDTHDSNEIIDATHDQFD